MEMQILQVREATPPVWTDKKQVIVGEHIVSRKWQSTRTLWFFCVYQSMVSRIYE